MITNGSGRYCILVVDDEEDVRDIFALILKHNGFRVFASGNDKTATNVLETEKPDILLTDRDMKGMSGEELTKYAKEHNPGIKVVMVTGRFIEDVQANAFRAGVDRILQKPVDQAVLVETINELLRAA